MKQRAWDKILLPVLLLVIALMLAKSAVFSEAAYSALKLCASVLVPTLFPFAVLSGLMIRSGVSSRVFDPWAALPASIFRCEKKAVSAVLLGLLCGFPIGAICLAALYREGMISRSSAERLSSCCTNASPAFVIAIAGKKLLGSYAAGAALLAVITAASMLNAICSRGQSPSDSAVSEKSGAENPAAAFTESVRSASITMITVSGFVVIFSVLCCLFRMILPDRSLIFALLSGFLELTNGLYALADVMLPFPLRFILIAAMLGFSGLCVHFQVISAFLPQSLDVRPYLQGKLRHALYSALLSIPAAFMLKPAVPAAATVPARSFLSFLAVAGWSLFSFSIFFTFLWKFVNQYVIMKKR